MFKRFTLYLFLLCAFPSFSAELSLRDKIGQMLIMGFDGKAVTHDSDVARWIDKQNIGGVILFDYSFRTKTFDKNIENPQQVAQLDQQLQELTHKATQHSHRLDLPLLISIDYEGGAVNRLHPRYGFPFIPNAKKIGEGSFEEANHYAHLMAETLLSAGINVDFAPVVDVNVNPENPIIGKLRRSFSEEPIKVGQFASIYSSAFKSNKIECAYKHFPGHGSSSSDSHLGFVDITQTWSAEELLPYSMELPNPNHCGMVMVAHVVNRNLDPEGLPASLSFSMISGLLRHDLGFDGVVITDDMQMKAITNSYGLAPALTLAINAGVDMFIFGNQIAEKVQDPEELIDLIEANVHSGAIPEERINEAYKRIMTMKGRMR
jgi:beta-N-acetylhexosaminidase